LSQGLSTALNPARVVTARPGLPPHIKAAVLALVATGR
jgi:hypothetical protein